MQRKVLVVEDEPAIADNITYALETEGFEVVRAGTGEEAHSVLGSETIDLVILDIGLPDTTGFDLCKEIRQTNAVPIIFLTARAEEIDRVVGLEIGGDDYVAKPFSPRELAARARAVLRRFPGGSVQPACVNSPFIVDRHKMTITYFGTPLELSRYEFRLLEVLIKEPGRVFTRDQLMTMVWEEPEASLDRTVDTHIKTLRHKLRSVKPDYDPIKTHRGTGYSLKEPE